MPVVNQGQVTGDPAIDARTGAGGLVSASGTFWVGTGVPPNSLGQNGDLYSRTDGGGAGARVYQKQAGAWVATAA